MPLPPAFVEDLALAVGEEFVITEPERLATYDCDGLTGWRARPACVVLPGSTDEVQAVLRLCARDRVPFVARGAGTGLSGGALPVADGVVVSVARMTRVLEVDVESERVVVEPGVTNLDVTRAVAPYGYFYAPDPSSQQVCTIGGNVAENSGGAHCLKHGFTVNHVTGAKVVLPDGELLEVGGRAIDGDDGPDLLGVIVGSEGTLGIAVEVTLRIVRQPEAVVTQLAAFTTVDAAGDAVSRIVAAGILPSAMEIMDRFTIQAAEEAYRPGYPEGAGSVLLVELDGVAVQVEEDTAAVDDLCRAAGAFEIRTARDAAERALLVARPQGCVRRDGARLARLLRPGRRGAAHEAPGGAAPHRRAVRGARSQGRERVPRGRRQPPSARPLRRRRGGPVRARQGPRRPDPGRVR